MGHPVVSNTAPQLLPAMWASLSTTTTQPKKRKTKQLVHNSSNPNKTIGFDTIEINLVP